MTSFDGKPILNPGHYPHTYTTIIIIIIYFTYALYGDVALFSYSITNDQWVPLLRFLFMMNPSRFVISYGIDSALALNALHGVVGTHIHMSGLIFD